MPYINPIRRRRALMGFGDYNDETQCSSIPAGDPYRKPGNYCATPDGGYTTFNADGSVYSVPSSSSGGSFFDKLGAAIGGALSQKPAAYPGYPVMPGYPMVPTGMSTTTKIALAGGAVALALVLARR